MSKEIPMSPSLLPYFWEQLNHEHTFFMSKPFGAHNREFKVLDTSKTSCAELVRAMQEKELEIVWTEGLCRF